jgi:hypothetical protein
VLRPSVRRGRLSTPPTSARRRASTRRSSGPSSNDGSSMPWRSSR